MLYCYFNKEKHRDKIPPNIDGWFEARYKPEWSEEPLVTKAIKEIDKSEFYPPYNVVSPALGSIPVGWLSGGVKCLIQMINMPDSIFLSSYMGDNCAGMLQEMSEKYDMHLLLNHMFRFVDNQVMYFPQYDRWVRSRQEYLDIVKEFYDDYKGH